MNEKERLFFLSVHKRLPLTLGRYKKLKSVFSTWEDSAKASASDLKKIGIEERFLSEWQAPSSPEKIWEDVTQKDIQMIFFEDTHYPWALSQISNPPMVLFYRGTWREEDFPCLSVVGSRGITQYGKRALQEIIPPLALHGVTIVSGLALGTDAWAHHTALENKTRTIAVLGNGIDQIYPAQNQSLAQKILQEDQGVILSEYFPQTKPRPEYFPMRNRIISGLSKATIVIEAAEKSGSLITARLALEQNREVFAVPGEIFSRQSRGTNELLLKSEAYPALSGTQILEHLGWKAQKEKKKIPISMSETEKEILSLFGNENKKHINDLVRASSLSSSALLSHISMMEIKGLVSNLGNQNYTINV